MFNDKITRFNLDEIKHKTLTLNGIPTADNPSGAISLKVGEQVIRGSTVPNGNGFTITLPSVVEAAGQLYSITQVVRDGSKDIAIIDLNGDAGLSNVILNATGEHVILLSDGYTWALIFDNR